MKIYKEYYVSVKPDSELAYVLPLTGSEKKIVEQKAKGESWAKSHKARETYIGCTVSENFKSYTYFYEWCNQQVGFSENNFELDKDLLSGVSKYYSEGTCVFLPQEINVAIIKQNKKRGDFPVGVTYHKNTGNFVAQLSTSTGRKHVGAFNNVIDAFAAYRKAKENYLVELAEKWKGSIDERAYDALISYQVSIDD